MSRRLAATATSVLVLAATTAGCGGKSHSNPSSAPAQVSLDVASHTGVGRFLVSNGRTLYMYPPDRRHAVTCTTADDCQSAWPPLFVKPGTTPKAGPGVDQSLIGVVAGDGGQVVTYNHWPLYYYIGDTKAGEVNGQDQGFNWFVIAPDGVPTKTGPVSQ
jgi:predicted lipoprotein with Yx(FWY)xxD motif